MNTEETRWLEPTALLGFKNVWNSQTFKYLLRHREASLRLRVFSIVPIVPIVPIMLMFVTGVIEVVEVER
jgi:hypothetical protein